MKHYKDNLYVDRFGRIYERYVLSNVSVPTLSKNPNLCN